MGICLTVAGATIALAGTSFTLSWEHSVEKVEWRENWQLEAAGLELIEAGVKSSGAGMEPPENARLVDGWWIYEPDLPPIEELVLGASGATSSGWMLCTDAGCREIGATASEPITVAPCETGANG